MSKLERADKTRQWHKDAALEIYDNLRRYFKDYGLGEEKHPPILDIAYDIEKHDPSCHRQGEGE